MTKTYQLEITVVPGGAFYAKSYMAEFDRLGLKYDVVTEDDPNTGLPLVRITGQKEAIQEYVAILYNSDGRKFNAVCRKIKLSK